MTCKVARFKAEYYKRRCEMCRADLDRLNVE